MHNPYTSAVLPNNTDEDHDDYFVEVRYLQGGSGSPVRLPRGVHPARASLRDASGNELDVAPWIELTEATDNEKPDESKSHTTDDDVMTEAADSVEVPTQAHSTTAGDAQNLDASARDDSQLSAKQLRKRNKNRERRRAKRELRHRQRLESHRMEAEATLHKQWQPAERQPGQGQRERRRPGRSNRTIRRRIAREARRESGFARTNLTRAEFEASGMANNPWLNERAMADRHDKSTTF